VITRSSGAQCLYLARGSCSHPLQRSGMYSSRGRLDHPLNRSGLFIAREAAAIIRSKAACLARERASRSPALASGVWYARAFSLLSLSASTQTCWFTGTHGAPLERDSARLEPINIPLLRSEDGWRSSARYGENRMKAKAIFWEANFWEANF